MGFCLTATAIKKSTFENRYWLMAQLTVLQRYEATLRYLGRSDGWKLLTPLPDLAICSSCGVSDANYIWTIASFSDSITLSWDFHALKVQPNHGK